MSAGNLAQAAEPIDEAPPQPPGSIATSEQHGQELLVVAGIGPEAFEAAHERAGRPLLALDGKADRLRRHGCRP